jgi:tetratricopeptide (TPR) repeat protein
MRKISLVLFIGLIFNLQVSAGSSIQNQYLNAVKLMNTGQTQLAYDWFKNMLKQTDDVKWRPSILFKLSECGVMLGHYAETEDYLNRILKSYPQSKYVYHSKKMLDKIKTELKEKTAAEPEKISIEVSELDNKVNNKPDEGTAEIIIDKNKAVYFDQRGIEKVLDKNAESNLNKIEELVNEGNNYFKNNYTEKALDSYLKALELDSSNNVIRFNIAVSYLKLEKFSEANSFFEQVYKSNPDDTEALKYVAYTYQKLNKPLISLIYWKRLKRMVPGDADADENIRLLNSVVTLN